MTPPDAERIQELALAERPRIVFGRGAVGRTGALARELGARSALVVTSPELAAAGHDENLLRSLSEAGVAAALYDRAPADPSGRDIGACVAFAAARGPFDVIVGLGGGSSLDAAKGANLVLGNGGRVRDYRGRGKATRPLLPLIAVPTTAGTGSECNSYAVISDEESGRKIACADEKALPAVAVLDPALTLTQPRRVAADSGIDAVSHALESAVARSATARSRGHSRDAFALTISALPRVLARPGDLGARAAMQLGAALGGLALESSMLGLAHALANPLTDRFGAVHGQAVGVVLPHVVRFNALDPSAGDVYRDLAAAGGVAPEGAPALEAAEAIAAAIEALLEFGEGPRTPAAFGASEAEIPLLAEEAARQLPARFNPRAATVSDLEALYRRAFQGAGLAALERGRT